MIHKFIRNCFTAFCCQSATSHFSRGAELKYRQMAYTWEKKLLHNWMIPDSDPSAATKEGTEPYGNMEGCKPNMETLHSDMYVKQKNNDDIIMPPLT